MQLDVEDITGRNADNETKAKSNSAGRLLSLIERIERMEAEKKERAEDVKEIYQEAKSAGFDCPTIRKIVKERAADPEKAQMALDLLETYRAALKG